MSTADAMRPCGRALEDEFRQRRTGDLTIHREDGHWGPVPVDRFLADELILPQEQLVLGRCRGRVLDVGAGGGRHSLRLQARGLEVWGLDVSPEATRVMRGRGVRRVRQGRFLDFAESGFDTALLLGHGLGLAGDLAGLDCWLAHLRRVVAPGGQVLADSLDVRRTGNEVHLAYQRRLELAGRYRGEMRFHLEYGGLAGDPFGWLHVDFETLCERAATQGWQGELVAEDGDGNYWCCLGPQAG
ncbi:MAG: methyltransferase domain-containing protein [Gemmatimonadota bacterium]